MVDLDEMMDKINNINARVEELYSKEVYSNKEAVNSVYGVNSDCYLKSCVAQQAKEITLLTRQVDNQKDTIKNMGDNIIAIAKERDNLAASLAAETERTKTCNKDFYEYRNRFLKEKLEKHDLNQELKKARSERDTIKALNEQLHADFDVLAKNHKELGEQYHDLMMKYENADCRIAKLRDELKDKEATIKMLKDDLEEKINEHTNALKFELVKEIERLKLECSVIKQELGDQLYYKDAEIKSLNDTISNLKLKREYDNLLKCLKGIWDELKNISGLDLEGEKNYD